MAELIRTEKIAYEEFGHKREYDVYVYKCKNCGKEVRLPAIMRGPFVMCPGCKFMWERDNEVKRAKKEIEKAYNEGFNKGFSEGYRKGLKVMESE